MADVWADGLMSYDRTGKRIPRLATELEVSDDGKTYTFKLRKGVKWSDGKPFTRPTRGLHAEATSPSSTPISASSCR